MVRGFNLARHGELFRSRRYPDVKDPAVCFDGSRWHVFGTGCGLPQGLEILHWVGPAIDGPWAELPPVELVDIDMIRNPAAPGVIAEGDELHMFIQHDFNVLDGHIEHLVSTDGGLTFVARDTALRSLAGTSEAGVYDPDPAVIGGDRFLSYAAMSEIGRPELFLARSTSSGWDGPWERCGRILAHHEVEYHNQLDAEDYEWGLEGPQLTELPDGTVLLTAVCFLSARPRGTRQRVLLAVADDAAGPYELLGPVIEPAHRHGENGHGTSIVDGDTVHTVYQERAGAGRPWRIRHTSAPSSALAQSPLREAG